MRRHPVRHAGSSAAVLRLCCGTWLQATLDAAQSPAKSASWMPSCSAVVYFAPGSTALIISRDSCLPSTKTQASQIDHDDVRA